MPRVKKEYFAAKKAEIVDAAVRVCEVKPAYSVTLRDVVKECGISTGGIYNYFSSIDEIFAEILNRAYDEFSVKHEVEKIFGSGKAPQEIIMDFFVLRGKLIDNIYRKFGKLVFELQAIYLNDPERGRKILAKITPSDEGLEILARLGEFIDGFKCVLPTGQILFLIIAASDGVKKAIIDPDSAAELARIGLPKNESATAESMMKILAQAVIKLLDIK
ncbi:MAG: TetR/AcrR family transcriptional regulator [Defluviitaleaceae bacterium]|nr:TetR/AcrR family transcriptional regulator [Defluviitaleaceae bacterium]